MASSSPLSKIDRAHQMYREGRYEEALHLYTEALLMARTKPQKIALHSNRAACFLKLHLFKKAVEECTLVLELDHKHTGALMLRAQTLVTLKDYHSALFDVNQLIELDPSSEVYRNLQARLKTQLALAPIPESEAELEEDEEDEAEPCRLGIRAKQVISRKNMETSAGGRSMKPEFDESSVGTEVNAMKSTGIQESSEIQAAQNMHDRTTKVVVPQKQGVNNSKGWQAIPKPKGHSTLDYARWDRVEDESSEDDDGDDEDEESQPSYRFRVRTVGVQPVK